MEHSGDFEQRPEVKPASSVPLPKEKASPVSKILCVVFALVALGLGGYIVYDKLSVSEEKSDKTEEVVSAQPTVSEENDTIAKIRRIKQILSDMREAMIEAGGDDSSSTSDRVGYVEYEFEDGYRTFLENSYAVYYESSKMDFRLSKPSAVNKFDAIMKKYDLKEANSLGMFGDSVKRYESDDGYICEFSVNSEPFSVNCSHSSWLGDDKKELVKTLIGVARKKDSGMVDDFLEVSVDGIKDSKNKPYQILDGSWEDGYAMFYRKDENAEWVYFGGGNGVTQCEDFDSEASLAFEGYNCYDKAIGNMTKVKAKK